MIIRLVSTGDLHNGATLAAYRLMRALREEGHDSRLLVCEKLSDDPDVIPISMQRYGLPGNLGGRIAYNLNVSLNRWGTQGKQSFLAGSLVHHPQLQAADLIHVHNLHEMRLGLPMSLLKKWSALKPVVWTLHDMWPMTGHCLYSMDCERWQTMCGGCPDLIRPMPLKRDTSRACMRHKLSIYASSRVELITPSAWLGGLARESPVMGHLKTTVINNCISEENFETVDQASARAALGLSPTAIVVLIASNYLNNRYKGPNDVLGVLTHLRSSLPDLTVVVMGGGEIPDALKQLCTVMHFGLVRNERFKLVIYSAADILLHPSLADNSPNTILEAMAAGCPTAAYAVGGVGELINADTGCLAPAGDTQALCRGMLDILRVRSPTRPAICRQRARLLSHPRIVSGKHTDLYRTIIAERSQNLQ